MKILNQKFNRKNIFNPLTAKLFYKKFKMVHLYTASKGTFDLDSWFQRSSLSWYSNTGVTWLQRIDSLIHNQELAGRAHACQSSCQNSIFLWNAFLKWRIIQFYLIQKPLMGECPFEKTFEKLSKKYKNQLDKWLNDPILYTMTNITASLSPWNQILVSFI